MSWDLRILGKPLPETPDQIVEALQFRGVALQWRPRDPARRDELNGYFVDSDPPTARQIRIHVEPPEHLEEFAEEYDLAPELQATIESAGADYWIGIESEYDEIWLKAAAQLVGYLVDRVSGVVFDPTSGEFLSAADWERAHGAGP